MKKLSISANKYMDRMAERIWGHPCLADVQGHLFDRPNVGVDRAQFPTSLVDPLETDGLLGKERETLLDSPFESKWIRSSCFRPSHCS